MRTLEQIINSIKLELRNSNSSLANFNKFSNLYIIFRTIAKSILEVESFIESENSIKYINNLSGSDLDIKAREFGLSRKTTGIKAYGSVLYSSNTTVTVPSNTVLTDPISKEQFIINQTLISNNVEQVTNITAVTAKNIAIPAGRELYSSLYSNVSFTIGSSRDTINNEAIGDIIGGASAETDESLRRRILSRMSISYSSTNNGLISAILEEEAISIAFIKNNIPFTGYLSIFINSNNSVVRDRVKRIIENNIAAGTNYFLYPIRTINIEVYLSIKVNTSVNLNEIEEKVLFILGDYIENIELGGVIKFNTMVGLVLNLNGILDVNFSSPLEDIQLEQDQLAFLQNAYLSINT